MESLQLGPLRAVAVDGGPSGSHSESTIEQLVVLLHGWGAPGTDLVGLARQLRPARPTRFVFPEAPRTVEGMSGPGAGRAWWPLDMMDLQMRRMMGQFDELARMEPAGLAQARRELDEAIAVLRRHVPDRKLYVGGFSQGSMLATDWVLESGADVEGLIVLSGTTLRESEWRDAARKRAGRVFQSHSPDDQVLPLTLAERFRELMREAQWEHSWVSFRGGHGIGPEVLQGLVQFLDQP